MKLLPTLPPRRAHPPTFFAPILGRSPPTTPVGLRSGLSLLIAAIAGCQLREFATWSSLRLAEHGRLCDDAYFISVVARNFERLGALSLDGHMTTNGFQPLWTGIQISLSLIWPDGDEAAFLSRSSWVSYVLFAFLATWWIARWRENLVLRVALFSLLITCNILFQGLVVKGLEIPLTLALVVGTILLVEHFGAPERLKKGVLRRPLTAFTLAVSATACFFGRTDLFWLPLVVGGWIWVRDRSSFRHVLIYLSVVGIMVTPYLLFNLRAEESLMPISGQVKRFYTSSFYPTWDAYFLSREWRGFFAGSRVWLPRTPYPVQATASLALMLGLQILVWHPRFRSRFPQSICLLAAVCAAHLLFMYGFYRAVRREYYFAPEILWMAAALVFLLTAGPTASAVARSRLGRFLAGVAASLVLMLGVYEWYREDQRTASPYWVTRLSLAQAIPDAVPGVERVAAFWPGAIAQFSGLSIAPLDGIIGSHEYFAEYVKKGRQLEYMDDEGIDYIVMPLPSRPAVLFGSEPPSVEDWNTLSLVQLWEQRDRLRVRLSRTYAGGGWYLLELGEKQARPATSRPSRLLPDSPVSSAGAPAPR